MSSIAFISTQLNKAFKQFGMCYKKKCESEAKALMLFLNKFREN